MTVLRLSSLLTETVEYFYTLSISRKNITSSTANTNPPMQHYWWSLPQLAQHTSWVRERWQQWWNLDSGLPPPAQRRAASSAKAEARRRPWSNLPVGGAAAQAGGSLVPQDVYGCPASEERARCVPGCGAGRQIQHLNKEKEEEGFVKLNRGRGQTKEAMMHPEIVKQQTANTYSGGGLNNMRMFSLPNSWLFLLYFESNRNTGPAGPLLLKSPFSKSHCWWSQFSQKEWAHSSEGNNWIWLRLHTCVHFFKLLFELSWCQSVLVQSVIPADLVQNLQVSADQPVPTFHHHLK